MTRLQEVREDLATNAPQWDAFLSPANVMVIAPPGSGKTKLLTARLAQDFLTEIPAPHGAACITYSTAAAGELDRRLSDLAVTRRSNLFVGTVHGFALRAIIAPYAPLAEREDVVLAKVATAPQRKATLERAVLEVYGPDEQAQYLESTLSRYRRQIDLDADNDRLFGGERVRTLNNVYSRLLKEAGLIDFDDMVRVAVELVEGHEWIRRVLAARFSKLFIDEYQDLGPGLHRLVKALCFDEAAQSGLFAVADPDQCIYMFSGATPETVYEIARRSDVSEIRLAFNYRCGDEIIRHSLTALDEPPEVSGNPGGTVTPHQVDGDVPGQIRAVLPLIQDAHATGTQYGQMAVLCLSNADCLVVARALREEGVPAYVRASDEYPRTDTTIWVEALAAWATQARGTASVPLSELIRQYHALLRRRVERVEDVALVQLLLDCSDPSARAVDLVTAVAETGLSAALNKRQDQEEQSESLTRMLADLSSGPLSTMTLAELGARAAARDQVHVLTMHGAKGLEFDIVFLMGLEKRRLPRWNADDMETVQARRQFYVAMTRARREVHIFYTGWHHNRYGRLFREGPSRFVRDLGIPLPF